jgi:hypothetical protein|tara:strand:- start:446 stop:1438 length:993 start_codon:yes stop_codon:yes gene_type:complete
MNNFLKYLLLLIYIISIGEISLRVISYLTNISDIEKLKYARKFIKNNNNLNLSNVHKPYAQSKLMGVNIELNSLGHRNKELRTDKSENEYRIYVAGGSPILGWGVKKENTFSSILERRLNANKEIRKNNRNIFVINAGIMNTNTKDHYSLFENQFNSTKPDALILGYFINDAEIINKKKNNLILKHSYFLAFIYQRIASYFFQGNISDYYVKLYNENSLGWVSVIHSIENLQIFCKKNNVDFNILFLPNHHDFSENNKLSSLYSKINNKFLSMNISVINTFDSLSKEFKTNPKLSWIAKDDSHPNFKAHEIIADDLYNFLITKQSNSIIK